MKATVILPEVRAISGEKALDRDLITSKDGRDLDKVLATGGAIQIIPREHLKVFTTIRKAVDRELLKVGTRFFGGYLVGEEVAEPATQILKDLQSKLLSAKQELMDNLDSIIEARVKDAPEWEDVIRSSAPSRQDIDESIGMSWVKSPIDLSDPEVEEALQGDPLAIRIAREIATACKTYLSKPSNGLAKGVVGIPFLESVRGKAQALSFVDGKLGGLELAITKVLDDLLASKNGTEIQKQSASLMAMACIQTMTNPARILEIGNDGQFALSFPDEPSANADTDAAVEETEAPVQAPATNPMVDMEALAW